MSGSWSHKLCGCFDECAICAVSTFLPCIVFGQNAEKMNVGSCCLCGFAFFLPILHTVMRVTVREKIRERNGIDGTMCNDCLVTTFCPFCSMAQETMEVRNVPSNNMCMARE